MRRMSEVRETIEEEQKVASAETAEGLESCQPTEQTAANELPLRENAGQKKRLKVFGVEFAYLYFLGIVMAFFGWVAENLVRFVTLGIIDSRFHVLPFIPVYGLIVFAVQILFGDTNDVAVFGKKIFKEQNRRNKILSNLICLLLMYFAVFFGELVVGNVWEAVSGVQLWNYNTLPLHVTQYAGLIPTLGYGTGAYLLARFCFCPAVRLLQRKANYKVILIIDCTLGVLLPVDELAMFLQIIIFQEAPVYWQIFLR